MYTIKSDSTGVTLYVLATDLFSNMPLSGLPHTEITVTYLRDRSAPVSAPAVEIGDPASDHYPGGFGEVDSGVLPGVYRFDVPDAALAGGAERVVLGLAASNALIRPIVVQLTSAVVDDLAGEVHLCKAALVNRREHTVSTGVDVIKDDDGSSTLVTLTPEDGGDDVIVVTPS